MMNPLLCADQIRKPLHIACFFIAAVLAPLLLDAIANGLLKPSVPAMISVLAETCAAAGGGG